MHDYEHEDGHLTPHTARKSANPDLQYPTLSRPPRHCKAHITWPPVSSPLIAKQHHAIASLPITAPSILCLFITALRKQSLAEQASESCAPAEDKIQTQTHDANSKILFLTGIPDYLSYSNKS